MAETMQASGVSQVSVGGHRETGCAECFDEDMFITHT